MSVSAKSENMNCASGTHGMIVRSAAAVVAVALLQVSVSATAEEGPYRPGSPEVLSPRKAERPDNGGQIVEAFGRAYASKNKPRVVLFWNRSLVDQLTEIKKSEKVTQVQKAGKTTTEFQEDSLGGRISGVASRHSETKTERMNETTEDKGKRTNPRERNAWALEDAVIRSLTAMGTKLVDRSAAMRFLVGERDMAPSSLDAVRVETDALLRKGDLLLEILMSEDFSAPSGWIYRILVKEIGSGRLLASGVTDARPPAKRPDRAFRAGERGFEKVSAPEPSLGEVAEELSNHVVTTLTLGLNR